MRWTPTSRRVEPLHGVPEGAHWREGCGCTSGSSWPRICSKPWTPDAPVARLARAQTAGLRGAPKGLRIHCFGAQPNSPPGCCSTTEASHPGIPGPTPCKLQGAPYTSGKVHDLIWAAEGEIVGVGHQVHPPAESASEPSHPGRSPWKGGGCRNPSSSAYARLGPRLRRGWRDIVWDFSAPLLAPPMDRDPPARDAHPMRHDVAAEHHLRCCGPIAALPKARQTSG